MPKITFQDTNNETIIIDAESGSSLMAAVFNKGPAGIEAHCGGRRANLHRRVGAQIGLIQ